MDLFQEVDFFTLDVADFTGKPAADDAVRAFSKVCAASPALSPFRELTALFI